MITRDYSKSDGYSYDTIGAALNIKENLIGKVDWMKQKRNTDVIIAKA